MAPLDRETRSALQESARRWIGDAKGHWRSGGAATQARSDEAVWRQIAELGWFGVLVGEEFGGLGLSLADLAAIAEPVGAGCLPMPVMAVAGVIAPLLAGLAASHPKAAAYLGDLLSGSLIVALAHGEAQSGYDRRHIETTMTQIKDGWRLDGEKAAVEAGATASSIIVTAKGPEGIAGFFVDRGAANLTITGYQSLNGRFLANVKLEGVVVTQEHLLPLTWFDLDAALDRGALMIMAEAVGAMTLLLDDTLNYLRIRQQFGQPLSKFQVLQHRAVDMFIALEEARATLETAVEHDQKDYDEFQCAVATAKVIGARAAKLIAREAVQLHGGIGMTDELRVSHLFKHLVVAENQYGDEGYYLDRYRRIVDSYNSCEV